MEDYILDENEKSNVRTTFISVLCVLTWIGSAMGVYNGLNSTFGPGPTKQLVKLQEIADKSSGSSKETIEQTINWMAEHIDQLEKMTLPFGVLAFVASLACAFGAWLMWNMRKKGFYIYAVAELLPALIMFYFMSPMLSDLTGPAGWGMKGAVYGGLVFGILFVAMYGVNLKKMK